MFGMIFHPHCTFLMKQNKSDVADIVCEFHAFQNGAENRTVKLKVAEVMEKVTNFYQGHCRRNLHVFFN